MVVGCLPRTWKAEWYQCWSMMAAPGTAGPALQMKAPLLNPAGAKSLIVFTVLALAWLAGFSSRLFAVIRFESIIHEFDPW